MDKIQAQLQTHIDLCQEVHDSMQSYLYTARIIIYETLKNGGNIYICANAQNILAAEYITRAINTKSKDKVAISLASDVYEMSAIANDHGYERVFELQIQSKLNAGDLLIAISNSGNSKNILRALSLARNMECKTIGLSGFDGGAMDEFCDLNIVVPSTKVERMFEMYILMAGVIIF